MTSPFERATPREEVSATVDKAAAEVAEVNGRIDAALRNLDELVNHPSSDLERQLDNYEEAVEKLEDSAAKLRQVTENMQNKGREYLVSWDREIATIHNEDLRNRTMQRRNEVAGRLDALHNSYVRAREELGPLFRRLNEVETALKVDLTPGGLQTIQPTVNNVNQAAEPARNALRELAEAFRQAAVALAAEAGLEQPTARAP